MHRRHGLTLLEVVLVLGFLILLALILIPALRVVARRSQYYGTHNGSQMTALAKSLTIWSDGFYPKTQDFPRVGLAPPPPNYTIASNAPTDRIAAVCNMGGDPFPPNMLIFAGSTDVTATGTARDIVLHSNNLSYAVLEAVNPEWKNKVNASAPILADKQVGKGSFWNKKYWEGDVGWGDTHVTWESGEKSSSWPSTTIQGYSNAHDNLFTRSTGPPASDAVLINP